MVIIEGDSFDTTYFLDLYLRKNVDKHDPNNQSAIIDYTKNRALKGLTSHYCTSGFHRDTMEDMTVEDSIYDFLSSHSSFEHYQTIVFHVNAPKSMIDEFKKLEEKVGQNLIVTIENQLVVPNIYQL